jgi:lipid-A-disaccharide synthase-like uncharacterized protein
VKHWDAWTIIWNIIGVTGQMVFTSRVVVQWFVTEKKKQVVMPDAYWWLSIVGSLMLLLFAVFYDKHYVIIFSYAFPWIPYVRNLIINHRHREAHLDCTKCGKSCPPEAKFCFECGTRLVPQNAAAPA